MQKAGALRGVVPYVHVACSSISLSRCGCPVQADALAGLTVGIMTVPQALSYARIAGLPSEYGLYGAFTPVLAYAVFGSSRQLVRQCWRSSRETLMGHGTLRAW